MNRAFFIALAVLLAAAGCAGSAPVTDGALPADGPPAPAAPLFDVGASLALVRSASGAPTGIRLTWLSVDDTATSGPYIVGYHVYKSASPIPDSARGEDSLWVEFGGDPLVPQPGAPGDPTGPVDDLFAAEYGQTWYYRLTAVASDGDESRLSPEAEIVVAPFEIISVAPARLGVGEQFTITGANFGEYDPAGDSVQVRGVVWEDGTGFVPALLEAPVVSGQWSAASITAILPLGATTGPVDLTIAGITVTSSDIITNSDPYITSLQPLAASILDNVTLEGANFGASQGPENFVTFGGAVVDARGYLSFSNTEIVFNPPNLQEYISHEVLVSAGGRTSNSGFCELRNEPPVAFLTANPTRGEAPLTVVFRPARMLAPGNWEYSYDPEGSIAEYRYDFDGDGTVDQTMMTADDVTHNYPSPGEYTPTLAVVDAEGLGGTAQANVRVSSSRLVLTLLSGPPPGPVYADTGAINLRYNISGGIPPVEIEWTLIDANDPTNEYQLAIDFGLPDGSHVRDFVLDTSTDVPEPGSGVIPLGSWQIRASATDSDPFNDPDGEFMVPVTPEGLPGVLDVFRLNVGVVSDDEADPADTEGPALVSLLGLKGYQTTYYSSSASLDPATLAMHHAVVWAAAGPFGSTQSFEWLGDVDQIVITAVEDLGCDVVIFGPPGLGSGPGPVFTFPPFNDSYQPFGSVTPFNGPQTLFTEDFTTNGAFGDYTVTGFDTGPQLGSCLSLQLLPGGLSQSAFVLGPDTFSVAASRVSPSGVARLYIGMYVFTQASSLTPAGATPAELLDNIVTGTAL